MTRKINTVTFIDVLNNEEAKELVERMDDMRASTDGEKRYAKEIKRIQQEIEELTGFSFDD